MSNFLLNLAQRGAGLAPSIAFQPPYTLPFAPQVEVAQKAEPETEHLPVEGVTPEPVERAMPSTPADTPSGPTPLRATAITAPSPLPQVTSSSLPSLVSARANPEPLPRLAERAAPRPEEVAPQAVSRLAEETPSTVVSEPQPSPAFGFVQPSVLPTTPAPRVESSVRAPDQSVESGPSRPPAQPALSGPIAELTTLPQPALNLPQRLEPDSVAAPAGIPSPPARETRETFESRIATQVQPVTPEDPARRQVVIRPALQTRESPALPAQAQPVAAQPEPRPIQVRIGTIEVRATTPAPAPPPAPVPQGFDDYVHIRTYAGWETD